MPSTTSRPTPRHGHLRRCTQIGSGFAALAATAGLAAAVPAAAADMPLLSQGTSGPAVARAQHALHIAASGRFDRSTRRAVLAFQRRDGLQVDGIIGPQTWGALTGQTPASSSGTVASTSSAGYSIPSSIVQCESGGDYSAVNSSSGAGGAYQILPSTWQAYGGQGLPQEAPKAEQDRIAGEIYARQGPSAWTC